MPKFFVVSDIHGFYDEMIEALNEAGFNPDDENHWLITCGDHFDRGNQALQVMKYLQGLPRKVLIRGNHEELFEDLCERGYPYGYDNANGTISTVWQLGLSNDFQECCDMAFHRTRQLFDKMVNYFETQKYIFVHSWIPVINKDGLSAHYTRNRKFEWNPDWRSAHFSEWEKARWGNPFDMVEQGLNQTGKIIVFGHWHSSTGWAKSEGRSEFGEDAKFEPYCGDGFISIDACTAHSGQVNVFVIEDDFLEDAYGNN